VLFSFAGCNNDSTPVSNTNTSPQSTGWVLDYHDYNIGSFFCNAQNPCSFEIITDTIDLTKSDSIRIYMSYHSIRNNFLTVTKFPVYLELFNYVFTDSTYGKIDRVFESYNSKMFLDFSFEIGTRFTIDTLQIFKKTSAKM
jgi:hypothetical protein